MPGPECVSEPDLRAFLLGALPERLARSVAGHLDGCPECEAAAARLDELTDPVIRSLRRGFLRLGKGATSGTTSATATDPGDSGAGERPGASPPLPKVAGYEIQNELARGGMSVVYQARQAHPNRVVALKVILAGAHAQPERRARFLAEANAIARLQHPHIVQIYEAGEHEGLPFLALEYVAGGNLAERLNGAPQPPAAAAALVETLARAVHFAHERGVVHRDLKPANVLLSFSDASQKRAGAERFCEASLNECVPKVTDFGLAKQERPELTATGAILGTPSYMAPEQAAGDNPGVGPAADVYSMGAILYEMLTGRPPFRGPTVLDTLDQVRTREPVAPTDLQPRTPRDLSTVCLKCLEKEPRRRYASAHELAEELLRFREGKAIRARAVGVLERGWRWCRRNRAVAVLLVLLVLATLGSALTAWQLQHTLEDVRRAKRDTADRLWESLVEQARARRLNPLPGRRFSSLEALDRAAAIRLDPRLRDEYIACLALSDLRPSHEWEGLPTGSSYINVADGLGRYVRSDGKGTVSVRRVAGDVEICRLTGFAPGPMPWFNPDGRLLAVWDASGRGSAGRLQVWKVDGPRPVRILPAVTGVAPETPEFSPHSRRLVFRHKDGSLRLYDLRRGRQLRRFAVADSDGHPAFHPRGGVLAVCGKSAVQLLDLATGGVRARFTQPEPTEMLAWHPRGRLLAVARKGGRIALWDVKAGRCTRVLPGHSRGGVALCFSHRGDLLASGGRDNVLRLWDPWSGDQLLAGPWLLPRFSRGDRRLGVFLNGHRLHIWEVAVSREYRTLVPSSGRPLTPATVHPSGRLLAVVMDNGIALWDLDRRTELALLPAAGAQGVCFEPSGALLVSTGKGLFRWPVRAFPGRRGVWRVGPPRRLPGFGPAGRVAASKDGRVLACAQPGGALVRHAGRPWALVRLSPHVGAHYIAVSPDGRWVATGALDGVGARVWESRSGRLVKVLPLGSYSQVAFSPDGKWLATDCGGRHLWAVGSWKEKRLPASEPFYRLAFSPDGRLLAGETFQGVVRLTDPATGKEFARLADPHRDNAQWSGFTPDGTRLVTVCRDRAAIHVWDLRSLRHKLARRGLDWDLPSFPPRPASRNRVRTLRVELDLP
jgi:WD40 repeat protein/tRNA A-37 threonylcarbamoyl transferase component Bud32